MLFLPNRNASSTSSPSQRHFIVAAALLPPLRLTRTFLSDHRPRPIAVLLYPGRGLTSPAFPKYKSSSPNRPLLLVATSPLPPLWSTEPFIYDHLPQPIIVLLLPDHSLTSPAFPNCKSSSPSRPLLMVAAAPPPPLWPTIPFSSDHLPRPIAVLLRPDHGLTPPVFPKCNSSSPGLPLLLAAATSGVGDRSLPLQPLSPTHHHPPPLGPRPDFPGVPEVQLFHFLSRVPTSSDRRLSRNGRRRLCD